MIVTANKSIILPAFTATNPLDSATIRHQRVYTVDEKFLFRMPVTQPDDVDWILCARWRSGLRVHRYKLWSLPASLIYMPTVEAYAGQVIYPEFVLEVWSLPGVVPVMTEDLELDTTIGFAGDCGGNENLEPETDDTFEQAWNSNVL